MPFVWNNNPNLPIVIPPEVLGPTEVSTEVHVVANTVNVSPLLGVLSYNTTNIGYDVIYGYDSLNVTNFHTDHLIGDNLRVGVANLNVAVINTAVIGNATIANLTAQQIFMNTTPSANEHMVTKGYVDTLVANSTPQGGNLQLLIQQAGDLLVGIADNTASRLAVGNSGQVLTAGGAATTNVQWVLFSGGGDQSSFRNLVIRTHTDYPQSNTKVQLLHADEIVMDDGTVTRNWSQTIADITVNGVNGLDTGTMTSNSWYEIYAIRNPTSNTQALLFHKALDRKPWITANDFFTFSVAQPVGRATNGFDTVLKASQQFIPPITGNVTSIEMSVNRTANGPSGNCWVTIEAQDAQGNASGVALATSSYRFAQDLPIETNAGRLRFVFDPPTQVVAGNGYCMVYNTDYSLSADRYTQLYGIATNTYPDGNAKIFSANTNTWRPITGTIISDFNFRVFIEANNTPLVMPSGYTQKCLLSYVSTGHGMWFREYSQRNRKMSMLHHWNWRFIDFNSGAAYEPYLQPHLIPSGTTFTIDASFGVPPTPCMVQLAHITSADSFLHRFADIHAPAITGNVVTAGGSIVEADGAIYANSPQGSGIYHNNPLLVEEQAFLYYVTSFSFALLMPATIEF
jgi:hypothetical protein